MQKQRVTAAMCAYGRTLSEPRLSPDGKHWILNGEKVFIANGSVGKLFFVDARTNPDVNVRQGGTLFIVPKDTPGFRVGKVFNKRPQLRD